MVNFHSNTKHIIIAIEFIPMVKRPATHHPMFTVPTQLKQQETLEIGIQLLMTFLLKVF